jgi:hypothetical protein
MFRDIDIPIESNDNLIYKDFICRKHNIAWVFVVHARKIYPNQGFLMGGMFWMKKNENIADINVLLDQWSKQDYYGSDEIFLAKVIYHLEKPICYYEPRLKDKNIFLQTNYEDYEQLKNNYILKKYTEIK